MTEHQCPNRVAFRRWWPGQPQDLVCWDHAEQSRVVASQMDTHVSLDRIRTPSDPPASPRFVNATCPQPETPDSVIQTPTDDLQCCGAVEWLENEG